MNIVGVGPAFCMGCCLNIRNGTATAAPAVWVSSTPKARQLYAQQRKNLNNTNTDY